MANLHRQRGALALERRELTEAVCLNPSLLDARLELAELDLNEGTPGNAMTWIDQTPASQRASLPVVAKRIKILLALRRYQDARTGIDQALKTGRSRDILLLDAQLRSVQRDFSGARLSAEQLLKEAPEDFAALDLVAATFHFEKRPDLALRRIREQAALSPKSPRLQYRFAMELLGNHDNPGARQGFAEAFRLDPTFYRAALELAKLDVREKRQEDARRRLTALISSKGMEVPARLVFAELELSSANAPAAIEQYRRVLNVDSSNLVALNNLASLLADAPNGMDEALKYAQQAKEIAPNESFVDDTIRWAFYRKGIYTTALEHLRVAALKYQNPVVKYHLAMAYFKAGDRRKAQETLAIALAENPNLPEATAARTLIAGR